MMRVRMDKVSAEERMGFEQRAIEESDRKI